MKILKKVLIGFAILIAIPLIAALFMKKEYVAEREVVINKPKTEVYNYLKYLKNQDNYSKWNQMDPQMKKSYKGTDGQIGFVSAWESKNSDLGVGEQEITKIVEGERMEVALRFKEPFESNDIAYFVTENYSDNQTKVKWGVKGKMAYPTNLMMAFMDMEKMLGDDLGEGLNNLKAVLEK
jgi:hypothetical protein